MSGSKLINTPPNFIRNMAKNFSNKNCTQTTRNRKLLMFQFASVDCMHKWQTI